MKYADYKRVMDQAKTEALEELQRLCKEKTAVWTANWLGCSAAMVCDMAKERRSISDKFLRKLLR